MILTHDLDELRSIRSSWRGTVGLVPTMGYLHEGHLSLMRRARQECDRVVVSIFVNSTQFSASEDLSRYPRDLERDLRLMEPLGVDLVWNPTPEIMYPAGYQTWVTVDALTRPLEGRLRPEHFRGVTTVVAKLFNAVQPHKTYFGQKDAQQVAVIRRMVRDLNFPLEVVTCPTVREADGLAMSSRNQYLVGKDRQAATILYRALSAANSAYHAGERSAAQLRQRMEAVLATESGVTIQYISCADYDSLEELETIGGKALLSMAVLIGRTRLIDNFVLDIESAPGV